jgi:hypothetical protein
VFFCILIKIEFNNIQKYPNNPQPKQLNNRRVMLSQSYNHNIIIPFYASWLYIMSSYYDFTKNKDAYKNVDFSNKVDNIFTNVFIYLPLSLYITLTIQPIEYNFHSMYFEVFHIFLNIVFGEIWLYIELCIQNTFTSIIKCTTR